MDYKNLSKTVSMALRHSPEKLGLTLSAEGWVTVEELIAGLARLDAKWDSVTPQDLEQMDAQSGKQRFEITDGRIRALYGHSTQDTQITYEPVQPPALLYHGTSPEVAQLILQEGIKPMSRQYVHLSDTVQLAKIVGSRKHKAPVVLQLDAATASADGIKFYHGNDNTWLADAISAKYIRVND